MKLTLEKKIREKVTSQTLHFGTSVLGFVTVCVQQRISTSWLYWESIEKWWNDIKVIIIINIDTLTSLFWVSCDRFRIRMGFRFRLEFTTICHYYLEQLSLLKGLYLTWDMRLYLCMYHTKQVYLIRIKRVTFQNQIQWKQQKSHWFRVHCVQEGMP